jgi:hypothetical protein
MSEDNQKKPAQNYTEIIQRINQIKDLFSFGEGIMPFLEELFVFLREATPMLNDVTKQVMQASGAMPGAADRLSSAVEETSDATYKIMRSAEDITNTIADMKSMMAMLGEENEEMTNGLNEIQNRADTIMNALQFHDIVSQRLIEVQKTLVDLQVKMIQLFTRVYELDMEEGVRQNILRTMGVNPTDLKKIIEAKIEQQANLTAKVDFEAKEEEYKQSKGMNKLSDQEISQTDIDALFG